MKASLSLPLAVGLLAVGAGCIDNWQSFYVRDNKRLGEPPGCEIPTDPNATGLLGGLLDVSIAYGYAAYLFTENGLIARADPGLPRAESNGIFVWGAYLNFEPDPLCGGVAMPAIETRFSNYIDPQGSATIGIWILPQVIGQALAGSVAGCPGGRMHIVVTVEMFGQTQAGTDVITQPFDYPITLCDGCLAYCPIGMTCPPTPAHPGTDCDCDNTTIETGELPCHPGQDDPIDCRLVAPCV
jgi:hypothetical protein